jgi:serine/threonine protein kinase
MDNLALSEKVRHRFRQEAYVQSQLDHPNIVKVTDFIVTPKHLGLVMPLIDGPSLHKVIADAGGPLPLEQARSIFMDVASAMAYAHQRGIAHRDIKPGNVLISPDGRAHVTDFGLAKVMAESDGITRTGSRMGTLPYMSPEQFEGRGDIGPPTDVFALGILLFHLLTGRLPIDPESMRDCMHFYSGSVPMPSVQEFNVEVPNQLAELIRRATSLDPKKRYVDAGELLFALSDTPLAPPIDDPLDSRGSEADLMIHALDSFTSGERDEEGDEVFMGTLPEAQISVSAQDSDSDELESGAEDALDYPMRRRQDWFEMTTGVLGQVFWAGVSLAIGLYIYLKIR